MARRREKANDDDAGWVYEGRDWDGAPRRWRVRMDKLDDFNHGICADMIVPFLEFGAREAGMTYHDYCAWVASLRHDQVLHYRDQIVNDQPGAIPWDVYDKWLDLRLALQEVQVARSMRRDGSLIWVSEHELP
ncbi:MULTISPECIES: hypothetical protein [unclassified Streptomyces]|uniref:hypothetical protein n=1 Tax=unclassified Streptomyces TaxID=2593676 RepID=UPI0035D9E2CC